MISAVLADEHPIMRKGLRALLEDEDHCRVIGEASDGLTALDLIVHLRPDVAVVDVQLPDLNGPEVARRARSRAGYEDRHALDDSDEPYVLDALRHGATGYLLKGAATTDLVQAVHAAVEGRRYLSAPLTERALDACARRAEEANRPFDRYEMPTTREREVLQLEAQGLSNAEVGNRLAISPRTAETHRANLLRKLGLQTQTDLVRFAVNRGLLPQSG